MRAYIKDFNTFLHLNESIETDPSFVDYIVSVEGVGPGSSPQKGHKAYRDIVGVWTIGYGHAETSDVLPRPKPGMKISDAKAREILRKDIADAERKVKEYISSRFPGRALDAIQLKMLTDYAFNPGLSKFPEFVKAVVNRDWKKASQEYKRYAGTKELTDRNQKFFDLFLAPLLRGEATKKPIARKPLSPEDKKRLEPMNPKPKQTASGFTVKGKTLYPKILNGESGMTKFANVREEPLIDNGWFDNIIRVVQYPNNLGVAIDRHVDDEGMTWYKVKDDQEQVGWVRSDVAIDTTNYPYI